MGKVTAMAKTVLLVFVASAIGQVLTYGGDVFSLGSGEWKGVVSAAIGAVLVFVYNYLSPYDHRYGVGSDE